MGKKPAAKTVIIITDGTEQIHKIADLITAVMADCKVRICSAENFAGTDLLPSDIFIIGCEKPNPPSFAYLKEMLMHINLISRKCALFSTNEKTLKYLCKIVKDCEAQVTEPLFAKDGEIKKADIKKWLKNIN